MTHLSTHHPQDTTPEPKYVSHNFRADTDTTAQWKIENIPWRTITIPRLIKREEFLRGSYHGRNAWNELVRGETLTKLYVSIPESLVREFNLLVEWNGARMVILKDARPDVEQEQHNKVEITFLYKWMGRPA